MAETDHQQHWTDSTAEQDRSSQPGEIAARKRRFVVTTMTTLKGQDCSKAGP
jgi:hypothetical protein